MTSRKGSARVSRVGFGVSPKQASDEFTIQPETSHTRKVRDREDALASTRDACATQSGAAAARSRHVLSFFFRRRRARELLEARIIPERIEHRIEPEQRGSERHV
jgi:hypothetical protein